MQGGVNAITTGAATQTIYDAANRTLGTMRWTNVVFQRTTAAAVVQPQVPGTVNGLTSWATQYRAETNMTLVSQWTMSVTTNSAAVVSLSNTEYDPAGLVLRTMDALGRLTAYGYDAGGRRTSVTNYLGWARTYTGAYANLWNATNLPGGSVTNYVTTFGYDANGNQVTTTDARGNTVTNVYDAANRLVATLFPAAGTNPPTMTRTAYDPLGRKISQTDEAAIVTAFGYDLLGHLTSVTNDVYGLALVTTYGYDQAGNQTSQTDANARTTTYEYDAFNRRTRRNLPLGTFETMGYDVGGAMLARTNFAGLVVTNQYDVMRRLVKRANAGTTLETDTYDVQGRLTNRVDPTGTYAWVYDPVDRLTNVVTPVGALYYAYDAGGALVSLSSATANGVSLGYGYDTMGRLNSVVDNRVGTNSLAAYGFDPVGNLQSVGYFNAVTNLYQYDARNHLTNLVWAKSGSVAAGFGYNLGPTGNRLGLSETNSGNVRNYTWTYDTLYRLTNDAVATTAPTGSLTYGYDNVGNRTTRSGSLGSLGAQSFNFDLQDQIDNDSNPTTASTYFDADGNSTNYSVASQYDWADRLTNYNSGAAVIAYDADGNRIRKTVGSTTTLYLVSAVNPTGYPQVVEELTVSGGTTNLSKVYSYGSDLVAQRVASGNVVSYYGYDGLGSVKFLTSSTGAVTDTYTYDAFGNLISSSGTTSNNFRYTGEQWDPDIGFYYLRARYMNPATGRFQTMDTYEGQQEEPLSIHKYLYAEANPVNNDDPTGLFSQGFGYLAEAAIQAVYAADHPGNVILNGKWTCLGGPIGAAFKLKPDIFNTSTRRWAEIKPLSQSGLVRAGISYAAYNAALLPFKYYPDASWNPSTHSAMAGSDPIIFFNAGGIIFYSDAISNVKAVLGLTTIAAARAYYTANQMTLTEGLISSLARIRALAIGGQGAATAKEEIEEGAEVLLDVMAF